jgi:hypothetical protein
VNSEPNAQAFPTWQPAADDAPKWIALASARHNVMLEGPRFATDRMVALLRPCLGGAVTRRLGGGPLRLLPGGRCTLIVEDVGSLTAEEQTRLREWLDDSPSVRIISTTDRSVFSLIERGQFDDALYYRLNVMLLRVGPETRG